MMNKSEYNDLMAKIAEGGKVSAETHAELTEFAKAKKVKRPAKDAILDAAAIKEASTTVGEAKAPKEKGPKAKCSVTAKEDPKMAKGEKCDADSRSDGMCAKHYSRLVYRAKPENAAKAREASNAYAKRVREEKAAAKAAAEKTAA